MTTLRRIVLHLARNPAVGFADGDDSRGYTIFAPLDKDSKVDMAAWRASHAQCRVLKFSPEEEEQAEGLLTHNGTHWRIHYSGRGIRKDEPFSGLAVHRFAPGEYITIKNQDDVDLVYRVVDVTPLPN